MRRGAARGASLALGLLAAGAGGAGAAVPAGFVDELVATVGAPTDVAFTPDGRLLVAGQGGTLWVYAPPAYSSSTVALAFAAGTLCSNSERGLLGVTVDPAFPANGHVYLFYTAQKPGTTGCPTGSTGVVNRVSRFTFSPPTGNTISPASEVVLIDNVASTNGNHNAGDLAFGRDGYLYVTTGDAGPGGNARIESILNGKILRIDVTGTTPSDRIPPTNPFQGPEAETCAVAGRTTTAGKTRCRETFAWGLRNPFRFAFDPASVATRFFVNDVGQGTWEEVDLGQSGADYGWNVREGPCATGSTTDCGPPPAGMTNPLYSYQHGVQVPGTTSPTSCNSITGGAFVPAGSWPTAYDGSYLFADFVCGWIFLRGPGGAVSDFVTDLGGSSATSLAFGTTGSGLAQALYYTTYAGGGQVRRIRHTGGGNRAPVAVLSASPTSGEAPLTVTFDGSGSGDPDGHVPLTYLWTFGDGSPELPTTSSATSHVYSVGTFTASLRVRDSIGTLSDPATVLVHAGNTPPVPSISSPSASLRFRVGQAIILTGSATDAEEGALPASALSWTVVLHHNEHTHPFLGPVSGNDVPLTAPAPEDLQATQGSYLEIRLTATDSLGATTTVSMDLQPNRVSLDFRTAPSGLRLEVGGTSIVAPRTLVSWEGWSLPVNAPAQADAGGSGVAFVSWSDGGGQSHSIATPPSDATYTASFTPSPVLFVEDVAVRAVGPGALAAVFTVTQVSPAAGGASVSYSTANGSALAGTDFTAASGTLAFSPGERTRRVMVGLPAGRPAGARKTFLLDLSSPVGAALADAQGMATLVYSVPWPDFDGDFEPDLLWQHQGAGYLATWLMNGVTLSEAASLVPGQVADLRWRVAGVADFDDDGTPDLLWQHQTLGYLSVWFMNGTTVKSAAALSPGQVTDTAWRVVGTGDFNRDGRPDLLWQHQSLGYLSVWYMNGVVLAGAAALSPGQVADVSWQVAGVGDWNADGEPDLLWWHRTLGYVSVWYMSGVTLTGAAALGPGPVADTGWQIRGVGDWNSDGRPDLLWQHQSLGYLAVWHMDGAALAAAAALSPGQVADLSWKLVPR